MSRGCSVSYFIRPAASLLALTTSAPTDMDDVLTEKKVWDMVEDVLDRTCEAEPLAYVKLVFMASLRADYPAEFADGSKGECGSRMEFLLGKSPLPPEVFDRWWIIERYVHERTRVEDVVASVDEAALTQLSAPKHPGVQKRLQAWIERKRSGKDRAYQAVHLP
jgi:hypothetical protein